MTGRGRVVVEFVRRHSANNEAAPVAPASSALRGRQKRFGRKVRTGCVTCRTRHLKCDESKPTCKRCLGAGRFCEGINYGGQVSPPDAREPALYRPSPSDTDIEPRGRPFTGGIGKSDRYACVIGSEPAPPSYDFLEAIRYFLCADWPAESARRGLSGTPSFSNVYKPSFCLTVTASYITRMAFNHNTLPHPSVSRFLSGAWLSLYEYKGQVLTSVSELLEGQILENKEIILRRICDVISTDFKLLGRSWRTHTTGALNILHMDNMISPASFWTKFAMHFIIISAVIANTTSPADNQIWEVYTFPIEDLQTMYSFQLSPENPWPTPIFLAVIRISYLRALMASGASYRSIILPATQRILDDINSFSFEDWIEEYPIPEGPETKIGVRTMISATKLYVILSLLHPLAHKEPYRSEKLAARNELLQLIKEAADILEDRLALAWPLSVVAVAFTDDTVKEKQLLADILCRNEHCDEFYNPQFRISILEKYWDSGKTFWDDCYFEPFPPLS